MAGIGFVLRKLSKQDNLIGMFRAIAHSALASTGPWLFTVLALGTMMVLGSTYISREGLYAFRVIVIYNFAFSLVFTAPIFMVATRYLADCIHKEDVSTAPGMLVGAMAIIFAIQLPIVSCFYLLYAVMDPITAFSSIINFMLISSIWLIAIFLTALKNYKMVTRSFGLGLLVSIVASYFFAENNDTAGMLNGFSAGMAFTVASLMGGVYAEYNYPLQKIFDFLRYFKKYWVIALSGFVYNLAAWVDKWIMWFSPHAERMDNNLISYPNYDSAMFLAYLSIVPSMAFFVFSIETSFFEHYLKFYRNIQQKAPFKIIQDNHRDILKCIMSSARDFMILQGSICLLAILSASRIFDFLGVNYLQIGMFRFGVLGAFFQVLTMFLCILLSYFDSRKHVLYVQSLFLVTNALFTYISMHAGFAYYGYGYLASTLVTFIFAAWVTAHYVVKLPYHTFITRNESV